MAYSPLVLVSLLSLKPCIPDLHETVDVVNSHLVCDGSLLSVVYNKEFYLAIY